MNLTSKEEVAKLIRNCIRGDRRAQQIFYDLFYGKMLAVCYRYSANSAEAKDMLHEGYLKAFSKLKDFKNEGSLEGWVRRIMVNNAIDMIRKKKELVIEESEEYLKSFPDDNLSGDEKEKLLKAKAEEIMSVLQELSPAYRAVFNLYVIENYSHKEIAEMLEISIGTSKSNLAKAKSKIRAILDQRNVDLFNTGE